jgi:Flp pilus assembly protein TadG
VATSFFWPAPLHFAMNHIDDKAEKQRSPLRRFLAMGEKFASQRGGLAAVEFALLLPFMLLLYLGSFEICQGISVKRQVALTASTVANIVTQYASISATSDLPDILNASATVLTPYSSSSAVVTVSLIGVDGSGNATVTWSQSLHGTARKVGQSVSLPSGLNVPNTSLVLGETSYPYAPLMDFMHMGTLNLYSSIYMLPRSSSGTITLMP